MGANGLGSQAALTRGLSCGPMQCRVHSVPLHTVCGRLSCLHSRAHNKHAQQAQLCNSAAHKHTTAPEDTLLLLAALSWGERGALLNFFSSTSSLLPLLHFRPPLMKDAPKFAQSLGNLWLAQNERKSPYGTRKVINSHTIATLCPLFPPHTLPAKSLPPTTSQLLALVYTLCTF